MKEEDKKEEKKDDKKEGILSKKEKKGKKRKSVNWDVKNLEDNELQSKLHPVTMKITEPKTPYTPYEEGDDEYFNKLNKVNATKPTEEVLDKVINKLENKVIETNENKNEKFIQIEVIEADGSIKKELAKDDHIHTNKFINKRDKAYKNEYTEAKKFLEEHKDEIGIDGNKKDLIEQTMENTLTNKFVGMAEKKKREMIEKEKEKDNENENK